MKNTPFNIQDLKNNTKATELISNKELMNLKGGQTDPPPFGIG